MEELTERLISQVEQHIHNRGRDEIVEQLQAEPTAQTVGQITYDLIMAMDEQAKQRGAPIDLEVLLPVATETIDMLVEIMEAMGTKEDLQTLREEAMMALVMIHMKAVEDDPEAKAAARELMQALADEGMFAEGMGYIEKRADADPDEMRARGQQMAAEMAPKQNPVAAGVQQGLMQP